MSEYLNKSTATFWTATICCFFLFWDTYAVKKVSIESIAGAAVFGGILFLYFCWFVYDTFASEQDVTMVEAIQYNLKKNAAVWAMCCYWLFFVFFVIDALFLHINNG